MYNSHNLAVAKVAAKRSIKPELQTVAFCGDCTVATDAFRMIRMTAEGEHCEPVLVDAARVKMLKLGKNDTATIDDFTTGRIAAEFPDYEQVISENSNRESVKVTVNAAYLADVLTVLGKLDKYHRVELNIPKTGEFKAIIVRAKSDTTSQEGIGLVMPIVK